MSDDTGLTQINKRILNEKGFTLPGAEHFEEVISDYSGEILKRTMSSANAERLDGQPREVTSMHVRNAAKAIASIIPKNTRSAWSIIGQVGEYLFTALAAAGAAHMSETPGAISFGVCLAIAVILLVVRLAKSGR